MERPSKRPRLSMFRDVDNDDATLTLARDRNDRHLKSRFELIFEKYERDFSDVADEIDLDTGEIIVDRGHLASMANEKDTAASRIKDKHSPLRDDADQRRYEGGRLLRAMTVAPDDFQRDRTEGEGDTEEDDDDVLVLFERIASNAAPKTDFSDVGIKQEPDSGDDYISVEQSASLQDDYNEEVTNYLSSEVCDGSRDSSIDSLMEDQTLRQRSGTSDSSLGGEENALSISQGSSEDSLLLVEQNRRSKSTSPQASEGSDSGNAAAFDNEAILDQYGPEVGGLILEVLRQRDAVKEARFEPVWRLPELGPTFDERPPKPAKLNHQNDEEIAPASAEEASNNTPAIEKSLWAPIRTRTRRNKIPPPPVLRAPPPRYAASVASEESDDPLQDDFHEEEQAKLPTVSADDWQDCIENGICPYCREHKEQLNQHFRSVVGRTEDGIHDLIYLKEFCEKYSRGKGDVQLFLDIVQLRELDNLGFREIAERTNVAMKTVYSTYYQYRSLQQPDDELASEGRSWTQHDDDLLLKAAEQPGATFKVLKQNIPNRRLGELGNRLATLHMQSFERQAVDIHNAVHKPASRNQGGPISGQSDSSEDDLFWPALENDRKLPNAVEDHDLVDDLFHDSNITVQGRSYRAASVSSDGHDSLFDA